MKKFFNLYPRFCFFVLFLIIFLPALSLSVFNFWRIYNIEKNSAEEQSVFLAKLTAVRQEQAAHETRELLSLLTQFPQLKNPKNPECNEILKNILEKYEEYTNIALLGPDGNVICSGIATEQLTNVSYREYFQKMIQEKKFIMGEYMIGSMSNKPVLPFIQPIFNSKEEIVNSIVVFRDLSWLHDFNSKVDLNERTTLLITDENLIILDCFLEEDNCIGKDLGTSDLAIHIFKERKKEGVVNSVLLGEVEKKYFFTSVDLENSSNRIYIIVGRENQTFSSLIISCFLPNSVLLLAVLLLAYLVAQKECSSCNLKEEKIDNKFTL